MKEASKMYDDKVLPAINKFFKSAWLENERIYGETVLPMY
jgi:hypothetical protein